jgi:DNA-binding PadR family transcriptional regulator
MKARGWPEVASAEDGRAQPFRLTDQGRKLLDRAITSWEEAQQRVNQLHGANIVNQLNHAIDHATDVLERGEKTPLLIDPSDSNRILLGLQRNQKYRIRF